MSSIKDIMHSMDERPLVYSPESADIIIITTLGPWMWSREASTTVMQKSCCAMNELVA